MDLITTIILGLTSCFIGFAIGRFGDKWGGQLKCPHHWIYGLILIGVGLFYFTNYLKIATISFGTGHFISDFEDFLNLKIWGADEPHKWKFWSIK